MMTPALSIWLNLLLLTLIKISYLLQTMQWWTNSTVYLVHVCTVLYSNLFCKSSCKYCSTGMDVPSRWASQGIVICYVSLLCMFCTVAHKGPVRHTPVQTGVPPVTHQWDIPVCMIKLGDIISVINPSETTHLTRGVSPVTVSTVCVSLVRAVPPVCHWWLAHWCLSHRWLVHWWLANQWLAHQHVSHRWLSHWWLPDWCVSPVYVSPVSHRCMSHLCMSHRCMSLAGVYLSSVCPCECILLWYQLVVNRPVATEGVFGCVLARLAWRVRACDLTRAQFHLCCAFTTLYLCANLVYFCASPDI